MHPEMGLTLLEGVDRPSYKYSSHSIVGFPPPGVRALLQGIFPQSRDNAAPTDGISPTRKPMRT